MSAGVGFLRSGERRDRGVGARKNGALLTGDKELDRALRALEYDMQKSIVVDALAEAAEIVVPKAKALAPYDATEETQHGKQVGRNLRDTIMVKRPTARSLEKLRPGRPIQVRVVVGTRAKLGIPKQYKGYYPAHIELGYVRKSSSRFGRALGFGTQVPARPYLRPALYGSSEQIKAMARRRIWDGIERSAKRHAREVG